MQLYICILVQTGSIRKIDLNLKHFGNTKFCATAANNVIILQESSHLKSLFPKTLTSTQTCYSFALLVFGIKCK